MRINKKLAAIGGAGVIAVGGAGLYAGGLTTTATGSLGAGDVALQASCASAANVTPGQSVWDATLKKFKFTTVKVDYTAGASSCLNQKATVNVFDSGTGSQLSTNATGYTVTSADVTATEFTVTVDTAIEASLRPPEVVSG